MNAEEFVRLMAKLNKPQKPFSMGTVGTVSGMKATIKFDGESSFSTKSYPSLAPYTPASGNRVLLANFAGTHVILGRIQN